MKLNNRIALALLVILAGRAASSLAAAPQTASILLPEISKELSEVVVSISLDARVKDSDGKAAFDGAIWRSTPVPGAWRDSEGNTLSRLTLPLGTLKDTGDLKMNLSYSLRYNSSEELKSLSARQALPLKEDGEHLTAAADLPFDLVTIDATGLSWTKRAKDNLGMVMWQVSNAATPGLINQGRLNMDDQVVRLVTGEVGALTPKISFICFSGKKFEWDGNGKDLRKSGLRIALTRPTGCTEPEVFSDN